ncbi:MAG: hypothetical protein DRH10_08505 [Deltaproteobacteria bacterium]|nr:MAG: hypothetical protein DRH10_08505 [Deltaproteobacteria bacterium]
MNKFYAAVDRDRNFILTVVADGEEEARQYFRERLGTPENRWLRREWEEAGEPVEVIASLSESGGR